VTDTEKQDSELVIHIDREQVRVSAESLTGQELRDLVSPPIGEDRDLYEVVQGPEGDRVITSNDLVLLRNGMHFFSAPRTIAAG
jgi:hypothetical protein